MKTKAFVYRPALACDQFRKYFIVNLSENVLSPVDCCYNETNFLTLKNEYEKKSTLT